MKNINGGEIYFKTAMEISPRIHGYIEEKIRRLKLSPCLEETLLDFLKKRDGKIIMRSTITYLVYKILGGEKNVDDLLPLLAVSELSNYHCYADNLIFDEKNNAQGQNAINMITAAAEVYRELCQQCIEDSSVNSLTKRRISKSLSEATIRSYEGQVQDLNLTADRIHEFNSDDDFLFTYEAKSRLQSGHLYGFSAEMGALLAHSDERLRLLSIEVGTIYGTGLHISCDLGDFALSNEDGSFKIYQDQHADIINGRLSLPIYFALRYGSNTDKRSLKKMVGNKHASIEDRKAASLAILRSGAFEKTIKLLNIYRNTTRKLIYQFPDNGYRDALSSMVSAIRKNKYLRSLKLLGNGQVGKINEIDIEDSHAKTYKLARCLQC